MPEIMTRQSLANTLGGPQMDPSPAAEPHIESAPPPEPRPASPEPKAPATSAAPKKSPEERHAVRGPMDLLKSLTVPPKKELKRMQDELKKQVGKDDITLKTDAPPKTAKPAKAAPLSPVAKEDPKPTTPPAVEKIKIGEKEYTAQEIEAALKAKETPPEPTVPRGTKPETPTEPAKTPEEQAKEERERQIKFVNEESEKINLDEFGLSLDDATYDNLLAGGKEAVAAAMNREKKIIAAADLRARKWMEDTINPILKDMTARIEPVAKTYDQVSQYQAEAKFIEKFPDLKNEGQNVREVREALLNGYQRAKNAERAGIATEADLHYVRTMEAMDQEAFDNDTAEHARKRMRPTTNGSAASSPSTTQQPPAPTAEAPPAPQRRPMPPVGNTGGSLPPIGGSPQAAMIARLRTRENV